MSVIGTVASVWRFPVKSMTGEEVEELFCSFAGFMGDRAYAVLDRDAEPRFPWLTARKHEPFLLYRPRYLDPIASARPAHAEPVEKNPGVVSAFPGPAAFAAEVTAPSGETFDLNAPEFIAHLEKATGKRLELRFSAKGAPDCSPVSLISRQSVEAFAGIAGQPMDLRRFRMNINFDWSGRPPFGEDALIGKTLRIGERLEIAVVATDDRCKMITLDPDSAASDPKIMRALAQSHGGAIGVYAAVLREGMVRRNDPISVIN